jgi:hypothetical protein
MKKSSYHKSTCLLSKQEKNYENWIFHILGMNLVNCCYYFIIFNYKFFFCCCGWICFSVAYVTLSRYNRKKWFMCWWWDSCKLLFVTRSKNYYILSFIRKTCKQESTMLVNFKWRKTLKKDQTHTVKIFMWNCCFHSWQLCALLF